MIFYIVIWFTFKVTEKHSNIYKSKVSILHIYITSPNSLNSPKRSTQFSFLVFPFAFSPLQICLLKFLFIYLFVCFFVWEADRHLGSFLKCSHVQDWDKWKPWTRNSVELPEASLLPARVCICRMLKSGARVKYWTQILQ